MSERDRPKWLKIAAFWVVLCLLVYGLVALEARQQDMGGPPIPTTYSAGYGGYRALYLWLEMLDLPVKRWEKSLAQLPPKASVLLMAEPEIGPDRDELGFLEGWVRRGGTLVLVMRPPGIFLNHFGVEIDKVGGPEDKAPEGGNMTGQPGPYTQGVHDVYSQSLGRFATTRPETVVHLRDNRGGLVAALNKGKGRVIAVADPGLFSNARLREGHHALLALNLLLTHHGGGDILFDEYHHGYGRATSVMGYFVRSRALQPLLQGGILLLFLWASAGRRFGSARPTVVREERSSMEYVTAMAQLFQRAGAGTLALKTVTRWIERESKRLLLDRDATLRKKVGAAGEASQGAQISDRDLVEQARGLYSALARAKERAGRVDT